MKFVKAKRKILFTGYVGVGGLLTFEEFKKVADSAKESGFTHVDLSNSMCERSRWQLDNNGEYQDNYDFYTEYTAAFADLFKFYCPDKLAEFLPVDKIKNNQNELARRANYLKEIGLKASIIGAFPQWLPESVYEKHPSWRGPRCDMPFRSKRPYFVPCVDNPEVLELFAQAAHGIGEVAPNLDTIIFMTNDSGTGFCWYYDAYPGINGPENCCNIPMAKRVGKFLDTIENALNVEDPFVYNATQGFWCFSGKLSPYEGNNKKEIVSFVRPPQDKPIIFANPFSLVEELENAVAINSDVIVVNIEHPQTMLEKDGLYFNILKHFDENPTDGITSRVLLLKKIINDLKLNNENDNHLLDAWQYLYRAVDDTAIKHLFYYSVFLYGCMSARFLIRPFVAIPENLTEEEKYYYKAHTFDSLVNEETEFDLINIHGSRNVYMGRNIYDAERSALCWNSVIVSLNMALNSFQKAMDNANNEETKSFVYDCYRRAKMFRAFAKNLRNCCEFQAQLDRFKTEGYSTLANSDKIELVMRNEYDNALDIIQLLEEPNQKALLPLLPEGVNETTFMFGNNLADLLRKKREIMLRHWRDSQILFEFKSRFNTI